MNPPDNDLRRGTSRPGLEGVALLMLLAIGVALRLGHALRGPIWRDEAQLLNIVSLPSLRDMLAFLVNHESHPPLFYLLVRGWRRVVPGSEHALLIPGILLGALTTALAWRHAGTLGTRRTAWVVAVLVALSPRLIEADATIRPYSLLGLVLFSSMILLWRALTTGSGRALAGWVLCCILLLYTHNWTILPVFGGGATALALTASRHSALKSSRVLAAGGAILLAWVPWWPTLLHQLQHGGQLRTVTSPLVRGPLHLVSSVPGLAIDAGIVLAAGTVGTLFLRGGRVKTDQAVRTWLVLVGGFTLLVMVIAIVASYRTNLLVLQTLPVLAPVVLVSVGVLLTLPEAKATLLAPTTLVLTLALSGREALLMALTPKSNVDVVAAYLDGHAASRDLVLLMPADLGSSFSRCYRGSARLFPFPEGSLHFPFEYDDRIPRESDPGTLRAAQALADNTIADGGRVWEVSVGVERHLAEPWLAFTTHLRELTGAPAQLVPVDSGRPPTLEQASIRVWARAGRQPE